MYDFIARDLAFDEGSWSDRTIIAEYSRTFADAFDRSFSEALDSAEVRRSVFEGVSMTQARAREPQSHIPGDYDRDFNEARTLAERIVQRRERLPESIQIPQHQLAAIMAPLYEYDTSIMGREHEYRRVTQTLAGRIFEARRAPLYYMQREEPFFAYYPGDQAVNVQYHHRRQVAYPLDSATELTPAVADAMAHGMGIPDDVSIVRRLLPSVPTVGFVERAVEEFFYTSRAELGILNSSGGEPLYLRALRDMYRDGVVNGDLNVRVIQEAFQLYCRRGRYLPEVEEFVRSMQRVGHTTASLPSDNPRPAYSDSFGTGRNSYARQLVSTPLLSDAAALTFQVDVNDGLMVHLDSLAGFMDTAMRPPRPRPEPAPPKDHPDTGKVLEKVRHRRALGLQVNRVVTKDGNVAMVSEERLSTKPRENRISLRKPRT